jgi:hypothetical protein
MVLIGRAAQGSLLLERKDRRSYFGRNLVCFEFYSTPNFSLEYVTTVKEEFVEGGQRVLYNGMAKWAPRLVQTVWRVGSGQFRALFWS